MFDGAIGRFDFLEIDDFVLMETTDILDFDFSWRVGNIDSLSCNSSAGISLLTWDFKLISRLKLTYALRYTVYSLYNTGFLRRKVYAETSSSGLSQARRDLHQFETRPTM